MIKLVNAVPIFMETVKENNFKIDPKEIHKYITNKTKIIIINNPSNPTGSVYTKEELSEIVDICSQYGIYIIADEIYEKICFNNNFTSIASINPIAKI